jgi:hypothetical protein
MSDTIRYPPELPSESESIDALVADISTAEQTIALAHLRERLEKNRASLLKHEQEFNEMYDRAGRNLPVEGLVLLAHSVGEAEKGAAERLDPWIRALQQARQVPSQEGREYIDDLIEISTAWLAVYQNTRARLLKLAAERRGRTSEVLRARPVAGEIDFAELSREHMARYPKIRAALAK